MDEALYIIGGLVLFLIVQQIWKDIKKLREIRRKNKNL